MIYPYSCIIFKYKMSRFTSLFFITLTFCVLYNKSFPTWKSKRYAPIFSLNSFPLKFNLFIICDSYINQFTHTIYAQKYIVYMDSQFFQLHFLYSAFLCILFFTVSMNHFYKNKIIILTWKNIWCIHQRNIFNYKSKIFCYIYT